MNELVQGLTEKRLREALENLQWLDEMLEPGVVTGRCPECESERKHGHADECKTGKALALPKTQAEKPAEALMDLFRIAFRGHTQDCIVNDPVAKHGCDCGWEVAVRIKAHACREAWLE